MGVRADRTTKFTTDEQAKVVEVNPTKPKYKSDDIADTGSDQWEHI